jgi:hypothetical protein
MDAAISKILHNAIATFTKTSIGKFESDATACFDRFVMVFAMLCFFAYGCPLLLIQFWMGVLQHHSHKVKTSHGVSSSGSMLTLPTPRSMALVKALVEVRALALSPPRSSYMHKTSYRMVSPSVTRPRASATSTVPICSSTTTPARPTSWFAGSTTSRRPLR